MSQSKILRFATIAAMFEMYSIAMYYFFAPVLGVNFFFKAFDSSPFFIFALFIFADYLARPIGAMVLGPYGDKCGRKQSLRISLILLMIGALAIACMPTYAVVGMAAPILVLVARVLQGFAAGGNTPGLITMAIEASETGQTGYCVARVFLGLVFGALLAYLVYTNLVFWTANTAYQPYIWRIGIGISGVLMMIPLFMLMRVEEYPEFLSQKAEKQLSQTPLDEFIRISGWFLLDALGGLAAVFVVLYMAFYAMPSYFESTVYLPMGEILLYYAAMLILMAFLLPLIGRL
ncbi:MAG: MFS transporter, partial [Gammaproteobacteria bacterium]